MSKRSHSMSSKEDESPKKIKNFAKVQDQGNVRLIEFNMTYSDEEDDSKSQDPNSENGVQESQELIMQEVVTLDEHGEEVTTEVAEHQEVTEEESILDSRFAEIVEHSELHGVEAGQHYLQIVDDDEGGMSTQIVDGSSLSQENGAVVQEDQYVEIDLMNLRLIRYDGDDCAQEVITDGSEMDGVVVATTEDGHQQRFVHINSIDEEDLGEQVAILQDDSDQFQRHGRAGYQYVQVVEKDSVPMVFYTNTPQGPPMPTNSRLISMPRSVNRKKRREFPLPVELMDSPKFKAFLYNCKQCEFKCNAIKELTAHRQIHQVNSSSRYRSFPKPPPISTFPPSPEPEEVVKYSSSSRDSGRERFRDHAPKEMMKSERKLSILSSKHMQGVYHCEKCDLKTGSRHIFKRHDCKGRCPVP